MADPSVYPLAWPVGWPRTHPAVRKDGRFGVHRRGGAFEPINIEIAISRLQDELDRIGAKHVVLSTNLETNLRGIPRGNSGEPRDPGVALYFQLRGKPTTMPCDRYTRVADNIAAIAAHIDATRAIERHGVGTLDQMFSGFQAIRGPGPKPWREILGFHGDTMVTVAMVTGKRADLAKRYHPDTAGASYDSYMAEINDAVDRARAELS